MRTRGKNRNGGEVPLRRFDWRFLLPPTDNAARTSAVVLGGSPEHAERLQSLGFAKSVTWDTPRGSEPVDAVIALGGAPPRPSAIARILAPGGVAYLEIDGPRMIGSRFSQSAFSAHGLEIVGRYTVLPGFDAAKVYLPVESGVAIRWVVESLVPASTRIRGLARRAFSSVGDRPRRLCARSYPRQALVVRPAQSGSALPLALGEAGCSDGARALLLCDAGNRVVMIPFDTRDAIPDRVVKVPKIAAFNDRTENEHARLVEIRAVLPTHLRRAVPRPITIRKVGDLALSVESYVKGDSLLASSGDRAASLERRIGDLRAAAEWLGEFHAGVRIRDGWWDEAAIDRWIVIPQAEYSSRFGTLDAEKRLFGAVRVHAEALIGLSFPTVWWHRDFNVWNLFRGESGLSVIDWEGAQPGPVLCDLLHLATHWYEAARRLRTEPARQDGFRTLFLSDAFPDPYARAAREVISEYLARVGLDPRFVPLMLVFLWVELALRRSRQLRDQGATLANPRDENRNFPYIGILAEGNPWQLVHNVAPSEGFGG